MQYEMIRSYDEADLLERLNSMSDRYEVAHFTAYLDTDMDKECLLCLLVSKGRGKGLFESKTP